jgi:hypothetical protein
LAETSEPAETSALVETSEPIEMKTMEKAKGRGKAKK